VEKSTDNRAKIHAAMKDLRSAEWHLSFKEERAAFLRERKERIPYDCWRRVMDEDRYRYHVVLTDSALAWTRGFEWNRCILQLYSLAKQEKANNKYAKKGI